MAELGLLFGPSGWWALLLSGATVTLALAVATLPIGFGAGLLLAIQRRSRWTLLRFCAEAYFTFFRGIPDLLALFIVYYGVQLLLDRVSQLIGLERLELNAFAAGALALGAVTSAYSSEVWLASFATLPRGQGEAARCLGLSRTQAFRLVMLPQLLRVAIPGMANIWSILLKDTSLISTLGVVDLLRAASEAARNTQEPILFYSTAAGGYLLVGLVSQIVQTVAERRLRVGYL